MRRYRFGAYAATWAMVGALVLASWPWSTVLAQSPPAPASDDAVTLEARALFGEGTGNAHRGEWSLALAAFQRSWALHPHAVTAYNIAYCERALGRYTRARKMFGEALADSAAHGGVELPQELAEAAKAYLAELERLIARAVISVSPEGASIVVDGSPLERADASGPRPVVWAGTRAPGEGEATPASMFELQIDPGAHVFAVSKAGYVEHVSTYDFHPGVVTNIELALSQAAPAAPKLGALPSNGGEEAEARPKPQNRGEDPEAHPPPSRWPVYAFASVGVAGLATGAIAGIVAIGIKGEGTSHYALAGTYADVSTAGFIAGGIGVTSAALAWWLLREPASPRRPPAASPSAAHQQRLGGGGRTRPSLGLSLSIFPCGGAVAGTF
jgi:hypothetical protein